MILKIDVSQYQFVSAGVRSAIEARRNFALAAQEESTKRKRGIASVTLTDGDCKRNLLSGVTALSVTGMVVKGSGWNGVVSDQSPLMTLAQSEDAREAGTVAALGGMSASLNAASANMQQSTAASWQNYNTMQQNNHLRDINQSIQQNTGAIRALNTPTYYGPRRY